MPKNWSQIVDKFKDVPVLVVGDLMLDRYWWGTVSRVSPEAPVPVVKLEKVTLTAGGAANVAANVAGLGATAFLIGAVGADEAGKLLPDVLAKCGVDSDHLVCLPDRPTTAKTRIVAHQQHVVRIDDEETNFLNASQSANVWAKIEQLLPQVEVVILSDYAKGCLSSHVLSNVIESAKRLKKPVLVDPKGRDYRKYIGATVLTPNKSEAAAASGIEIHDAESIIAAGQKLMRELDLGSLLITLGEDGMQLFEKNKPEQHFPARARKVYDVTGAGDTVIAALAIALGAKLDLASAVEIANAAAGLAVEQVGTAVINLDDLQEHLLAI